MALSVVLQMSDAGEGAPLAVQPVGNPGSTSAEVLVASEHNPAQSVPLQAGGGVQKISHAARRRQVRSSAACSALLCLYYVVWPCRGGPGLVLAVNRMCGQGLPGTNAACLLPQVCHMHTICPMSGSLLPLTSRTTTPQALRRLSA